MKDRFKTKGTMGNIVSPKVIKVKPPSTSLIQIKKPFIWFFYYL